MRYSQLFGKTQRRPPRDATFASHQLLHRGGFVRESTAGRYYYLPLGWRVHEKIRAIIKDEMDKTGAQEMITPVLHPLHLWEETNRTSSVGFELMTVTDGREFQFALGGTAEEMFVDLVRRRQLSYRDLPFHLYQFSTKFRDELRARGGLLRVREFVMKDGYSFHADETDFKREYEVMAQTYTNIFARVGLKTLKVEADNGYIGGEYCHEFQVESPIGEGRFFVSDDGTYAAHEDVAAFARGDKNSMEKEKPYKEVSAKRGNTMEDGVQLHSLPLWQQIKDVCYADENDNLILAVMRGDLDVNEAKLRHAAGVYNLRAATPAEIRSIGSEPGFISPVGLSGKVKIIGDPSLQTVKNFYGGANKKHVDAVNINIDRDFTVDIEADIAMAQDGFTTADGKSTLRQRRGIEVGNIFQLGYHYSKKMKGATFVDEDGAEKPYYMGCYGIGLGRTMAAIVENSHDAAGIIWPEPVAPFTAHLISLPGGEKKAAAVYQQLTDAGLDVLWDDRDESAGVKFADSDLIGCPYRVIVSKKTGERVEVKRRSEQQSSLVSLTDFTKQLK